MDDDLLARPHRNALVRENCPDPAIFRAHGPSALFYVVCTTNDNDAPDKLALRRSADLVTWEPAGFVFPRGAWPTWARRDFWAPEIHRVGDRYIAYFTARDLGGQLCIGAATADHPEGPWRDLGQPLLRDPGVGLIDAHYFQDSDGRSYLYWKEDGNGLRGAARRPSVICAQEIAADGLTFVGPRVELIRNDLRWEGLVVEGPWVVHRHGAYFLFYAAHKFNSRRYATGVARSASPLGPFEKLESPILRSNRRWHGPGHGSVISIGERDYFVYHAWEPGRIDRRWDVSVHPRMMLVDRIEWDGGWPRIHDGTPSGGPSDETALAATSVAAPPRRPRLTARAPRTSPRRSADKRKRPPSSRDG
jgi:arabinan endo-1,5-alpha-L-arabinosidase